MSAQRGFYGPGDGYQGSPAWTTDQINALFQTFDAVKAALAGYVALPPGTPSVGQVLVVASVDPLVLVWGDTAPVSTADVLVTDSGNTLVTDTGDRLLLVTS